jgi:SAM-dependent methyltransferase
MLEEWLRANLARWNELTQVHAASDFYDVEGFRHGRETLTSIEADELGPDVGEGTRLLHLQCHFGLDTLSWARRGATVTGVDFSEEAVALARQLADDVGLQSRARFLCSDVYRLPEALDERFDVVFTSWGVLTWLGDLRRWAQVAARFVRPGGIFYIAEFHPFAFILDDGEHSSELRLSYPYFQGAEPMRFDEPGSYADPGAPTRHSVTYEWNHTLGGIVTSLIEAGLEVEWLHEFPHTQGLTFPFLEKGEDGWLRVRGHEEDYPLSFSLKARRPLEGRNNSLP